MTLLLSTLLLSLGLQYPPQYEAQFATVACADEGFMRDLVDAYRARDEQAINTALLAATLADDCVFIDKGEAVDVLDRPVFSDLMEIRKRGKLGRFHAIRNLFDERS